MHLGFSGGAVALFLTHPLVLLVVLVVLVLPFVLLSQAGANVPAT